MRVDVNSFCIGLLLSLDFHWNCDSLRLRYGSCALYPVSFSSSRGKTSEFQRQFSVSWLAYYYAFSFWFSSIVTSKSRNGLVPLFTFSIVNFKFRCTLLAYWRIWSISSNFADLKMSTYHANILHPDRSFSTARHFSHFHILKSPLFLSSRVILAYFRWIQNKHDVQ